jgi:hypothetical protein
MALPGKYARIRIMSETSTAFSTESTTADASLRIYTIDDRDLKYWDREVAVQVFRNALLVPTSEYRVQHAGGRIHFWEPQDPGDAITVSGAYVTVVIAAECNEYTLTNESEVIDVTVFESDGWRERLAGILGASGTVSGFWVVNNLFTPRLLAQKPLILELQANKNDPEVYAMYVVIESQELAPAVEGAVETSVSWQSDGDILIEQ